MITIATVSTVRQGFSYERAQVVAHDWRDFMSNLETEIRILSDENPDRILISLERPK